MNLHNVPLANSIVLELLKKIFSVYCVAAIIIYLFQGWVEYSQTKDRVTLNMAGYQPLVEKSLTNAVWNLDSQMLQILIDGVVSQSIITEVCIYNENHEILAQARKTTSAEKTLKEPRAGCSPVLKGKSSYQHSFELFDPNGLEKAAIGSAQFFTSKDVVINNIKLTLIALMLAAIVKTAILWIVFIYFGRKLLSRPLHRLITNIQALAVQYYGESDIHQKKGINELSLLQLVLTQLDQRLRSTLVDLRLSNEKLSSSNIHLQRAVEQSPTISIILSTDGKVIYTTPSFSTLTGYSSAEADDVFYKYFLTNKSFKLILKKFANNYLKTDKWNSEVEILDKNNFSLYLAVSISATYSDEGDIESFLYSANDISSLKKMELNLKQKNSEQQETIEKFAETQVHLVHSESMALVCQLAAGIAHEINNPVGFVNSNISILETYFNDLLHLTNLYENLNKNLLKDTAEIQSYREIIDFEFLRDDIPKIVSETKDGLSRVIKIVRDLLSFSSDDKTKFTYYDIRKGLESTLNVAWREIKYKANIIKEFDEIPEIECIPSHLNQVFMNLMVNAAQSIDSQGSITLRTKLLEDKVVIEIEDDGSGIAPENLNKLFDPFFTTKPVGKGTGLGLSISYGIIKKHNGQITVDSHLGEGTCFRIYLPIRRPATL